METPRAASIGAKHRRAMCVGGADVSRRRCGPGFSRVSGNSATRGIAAATVWLVPNNGEGTPPAMRRRKLHE